jgi:molybdate transport system substrate-binding protein
MSAWRRTLALAGLALCLAGCADEDGDALIIYAAASTQPIVDEIASAWEAAGGGRVICNYAASSTLAMQIARGAPADVFISANGAWMDDLQERGAVNAASRRDLLANTLVIVGPASRAAPDGGDGLAALLGGDERIAVGDPEHVPLGAYTQQALEAAGAWTEDVRGRLVPAPDARATLRLVELGAVDLAVVYASDAAASALVRAIADVPGGMHDPIRYPVAACSGTEPAEGFMQFLDSIDLDAIARRHHFRPAGESP